MTLQLFLRTFLACLLALPVQWASASAPNLQFSASFPKPTQSELILPQERPLFIPQVEVLSRKTSVDMSWIADIQFESWIELDLPDSPSVIIGLSQRGDLVQVGQVNDRRVGRILSAQHKITRFAMTPEGGLLMVDTKNRLLLFDPAAWALSPLPKFARQGAVIWAATTLLVGIGLKAFGSDLVVEDASTFFLLNGFSSFGAALTLMLVQAVRFDSLNSRPNGLIDTNTLIQSEADLHAWGQFAREHLRKSSFEDWAPPCEATLLPLPPESAIIRSKM